ncbi:MAG: NAD(P)H-quinone oxidoreductase, partial [Acidimicrobiales bacterium]
MRAVVLDRKGGPEVLVVRDVPAPEPTADEVLVDVVTTSVNRADLLQRQGLYPGPPMTHEIPGLELAGRVRSVGERVTTWQPGDAVMGIIGGGGYAEQVAIHARQLLSVPELLDLSVAGAVPEVFITAWDALVVQGGLMSGRWALVHAGASGVGTAAIQIVKALGGRIVVTASAPKHDLCRELGADEVVDYRTEDFVAAVRDLTGGRGVDVVLDVIGGEYLARHLESVRVGGRVVQVGVMAGGRAEIDLGRLLPKRVSLIGTVLRARPLEEKIAITRRFSAEVLPLLAAGRLRPVIDSRFQLD